MKKNLKNKYFSLNDKPITDKPIFLKITKDSSV